MSDRRTEENEPEPLVVKPKVAWRMLACSNTRGYELLAAGELESFKDGRSPCGQNIGLRLLSLRSRI
jgi:hypothetical protein